MQNALFDVLYIHMFPRSVRELTKCPKIKPSLFSSVPKRGYNGADPDLLLICCNIGNVGWLYTQGLIRNVAIRINAMPDVFWK